jgi:hypothetical protein
VTDYNNMISNITMSITAPTDRYTPPVSSVRCFFVARTSLRNSFFSDELSFDLSISLISFNLEIKAFASAASAVFVVVADVAVSVPAFNCAGINVNDRNAVIIQTVSFFIILNLNVNSVLQNKGDNLCRSNCYITFAISYIIPRVGKNEITYFFEEGVRMFITLASGYLSSHNFNDDKCGSVMNVL